MACAVALSAMDRLIAIDCLNCGRCRSIPERQLVNFGWEPGVSLVTLTKRLVCSDCGSKAVRAFRYLDDPDQAQFVHGSPSVVPKS